MISLHAPENGRATMSICCMLPHPFSSLSCAHSVSAGRADVLVRGAHVGDDLVRHWNKKCAQDGGLVHPMHVHKEGTEGLHHRQELQESSLMRRGLENTGLMQGESVLAAMA